MIQEPTASVGDRMRSAVGGLFSSAKGAAGGVANKAQQVRTRVHEQRVGRRVAREAAREETASLAAVEEEQPVVVRSTAKKAPVLRRRVVGESAVVDGKTVVESEEPAASSAVAVPRVEKPTRSGGLLARKRQLSALEQAQQALAANDCQLAEDVLVAHIVKHTKDTDAYMLLGQAAMQRQNWQEAMEIYEQVVRWNSNQQGVMAALGGAAYKAGRYTKALEMLQRAHELDPDNRVILEQLLGIAQKLDNPALCHSIEEKLEQFSDTEKPAEPARTKERVAST